MWKPQAKLYLLIAVFLNVLETRSNEQGNEKRSRYAQKSPNLPQKSFDRKCCAQSNPSKYRSQGRIFLVDALSSYILLTIRKKYRGLNERKSKMV